MNTRLEYVAWSLDALAEEAHVGGAFPGWIR